MKIRWMLCEKKDVEEFRAHLMRYTVAVQSLLSAMQMYDLWTKFPELRSLLTVSQGKNGLSGKKTS